MHNYAVGTYTNELFIYHRFLCTYQLICQRETLLFFVVYAIISTCFEKKNQMYLDHLYTVIVLLDTCSSGLYCL